MRSQLSAYADGELTPAMTQQVRTHLTGCEQCAQELSGLRRLTTLTGAIPLEDVSAALQQRIMASLHQAKFTPEPVPAPVSRSSFRPLTWAMAAFATAAIAVACGTLVRPGHSPANALGTSVAEATPTASVNRGGLPRHATEVKRTPDAAPVSEAPAPIHEQPTLTAEAPAAPALDNEVESPAPVETKLAPVVNASPTEKRIAAVMPPATATAERPQPAPVSPSGKLAAEPKGSEPSVQAPVTMMARENLMAMPGDPIVNSTGTSPLPDPVGGTEKDASTRMAGMAIETESPGEEDEGLRSFRMFLQENNRTVPQPPSATPGRERRMRKSL